MVSYCRQYISFYGHIIYRSTVVKWLKCWYDMEPTWNTLIMLFVMPSIGRFTIAAAKFLCFCWIVEPRWFILFLYLYLHFLKALYLVTLLTDLNLHFLIITRSPESGRCMTYFSSALLKPGFWAHLLLQ